MLSRKMLNCLDLDYSVNGRHQAGSLSIGRLDSLPVSICPLGEGERGVVVGGEYYYESQRLSVAERSRRSLSSKRRRQITVLSRDSAFGPRTSWSGLLASRPLQINKSRCC